jgi:hypothetical protein
MTVHISGSFHPGIAKKSRHEPISPAGLMDVKKSLLLDNEAGQAREIMSRISTPEQTDRGTRCVRALDAARGLRRGGGGVFGWL